MNLFTANSYDCEIQKNLVVGAVPWGNLGHGFLFILRLTFHRNIVSYPIMKLVPPPITSGNWQTGNGDSFSGIHDVFSNQEQDSLIFVTRFMGGDNKEGQANGKVCASIPTMLKALETAFQTAYDALVAAGYKIEL